MAYSKSLAAVSIPDPNIGILYVFLVKGTCNFQGKDTKLFMEGGCLGTLFASSGSVGGLFFYVGRCFLCAH